MAHEFPQLAFTRWLENAVTRITQAVLHDADQEHFLSRAVDVCDLERRQRAMRSREHALHTFW